MDSQLQEKRVSKHIAYGSYDPQNRFAKQGPLKNCWELFFLSADSIKSILTMLNLNKNSRNAISTQCTEYKKLKLHRC